jgi:hypothetical protein
VLLLVDALAGAVLHVVQALAFTGRDGAVGLGMGFGACHALLLALQAAGFALVQLAAGLALFDALFLALLALVDARRGARSGGAGLGQNGGREQGQQGG